MKYALPFILILITFLSGISCKENISPETSELLELPLEVGNSWTYNVTSINFRSGDTTRTEVTFTVAKDTIVNGIRWAFLESESRFHQNLMGGYYSNQEDGIFYIQRFQSQTNEETELDNLKAYLPESERLSFTEYPKMKENNESFFPVFLHHPDPNIPSRILESDYFIASVTYLGKTDNKDLNAPSYNFKRTYYQIQTGSRVYSLNPFDLNYSINNSFGFIKFENMYYSAIGSTEEDPRLQPLTLVSFNLTETNL